MDPQLGQIAFRIGVFMALTAGGLLLFLDRSSPEFVVSVLTLAIAISFLTVIAFMVRHQP